MIQRDRDFVWEEVGRVGLCFFVAMGREDLHISLMMGRPDPSEEIIWFTAEADDGLTETLSDVSTVRLAYQDPPRQVYMVLAGEVTRADSPAASALSPAQPLGFMGSTGDTNTALIGVRPTHAEVWQAPHEDVIGALGALTGAGTTDKASRRKRTIDLS
ncbi:MAG: pyridoxamine 5'-phosphate oxidase family protein [Pseudomonadota bacterium]